MDSENFGFVVERYDAQVLAAMRSKGLRVYGLGGPEVNFQSLREMGYFYHITKAGTVEFGGSWGCVAS